MVRPHVPYFDKMYLTWLSTKKSTEWSPIHPSKNQCPVPEICMTGSSYRNGSSYLVDVTAGCTSSEKSVPVNSSPSRTGDCSVSSSTGGDSVLADPSDLYRDPFCNFAAGGAGLNISHPGW